LYGANAGGRNLTGLTNARVAVFFQRLWARRRDNADVEVLATALNVYATTVALGGAQGAAAGFRVTDGGLGARSINVGTDGAAFGVANFTRITVCELLQGVNRKAVKSVVANGNAHLRALTADLCERLRLLRE